MVENLKKCFTLITFEQVPREKNKASYAMATLASLLQILDQSAMYEFLVEEVEQPAFDPTHPHTICLLTTHESPWYGEIYTYLKDQILPMDQTKNQKKSFIPQATRYTLISDTLYHKSLDGMLLRCLEKEELDISLWEIHEGIHGSHFNGLTLAKKLLTIGYFWPIMEKDACHFAKTCRKCQYHGNLIHVPIQELHPMMTP